MPIQSDITELDYSEEITCCVQRCSAGWRVLIGLDDKRGAIPRPTLWGTTEATPFLAYMKAATMITELAMDRDAAIAKYSL